MTFYNIHSASELTAEQWHEAWGENLTEKEKVIIWNKYCEHNRYDDERILTCDDICEIVSNMEPGDAFDCAQKSDRLSDFTYFKYDGCSFDGISDVEDEMDLESVQSKYPELLDDFMDIDQYFEDEEENDNEE